MAKPLDEPPLDGPNPSSLVDPKSPSSSMPEASAESLEPPSSSDPTQKRWMESDKDADVIPYNNMWLVAPSMMLVMFLAALDNTIVTTALPTISSKFNATREFLYIKTCPSGCSIGLNIQRVNILGSALLTSWSRPSWFHCGGVVSVCLHYQEKKMRELMRTTLQSPI